MSSSRLKDRSQPKNFSTKVPVTVTGSPVEDFPVLGNSAKGEHFDLILCPPLDFHFAYRIPQYLVFSPYAPSTIELSVSEGTTYRRLLGTGDAVLVPPSTTFRMRLTEPVEMLIVFAQPEYVDKVFDRVARGRPWAPGVIDEHKDPGFAALQRELRRSLLGDPIKEPAYLEQLVEGMLCRLGCHLVGHSTTNPAKEMLKPSLVRQLVNYIESNLALKLSVKELADMAELSRSHFTRAFRAATGDSPQEFIIARRLSRAREMLADNKSTIAEVAASAGFSSQAHLTTAFKKRLGVTPSDYRVAFRK